MMDLIAEALSKAKSGDMDRLVEAFADELIRIDFDIDVQGDILDELRVAIPRAFRMAATRIS